jgi:hypothetical protein
MKTRTKLSPLAKLIADRYMVAVRGSESFLTDTMRHALVSEAMFSVMLIHYEVSGGGHPMAPYVEANIEVQTSIGLRD